MKSASILFAAAVSAGLSISAAPALAQETNTTAGAAAAADPVPVPSEKMEPAAPTPGQPVDAAASPPSEKMTAEACASAGTVPQSDLLNATLWMQRAIEYKANAINVFTLARIRLDEALADKSWTATGQSGAYQDLPPAIILDVDETVLDNSAYEAGLIKTASDYSGKTYNQWVGAAAAKAIPGALDFLRYADSKGVKIFYVTNRAANEEEGTRKNMEALGFPMGGNVDTFLMSKEKEDWTSKKGTRRDFVSKDYRVVELFGDNYGDFSDDAGKSEAERLASFEQNQEHFTKDWFVIANPSYGSFESAAFGHDFKLPADVRRCMKIGVLEAWTPAAQ